MHFMLIHTHTERIVFIQTRTGLVLIQTNRETYWFYAHKDAQRDVLVLFSYRQRETYGFYAHINTQRDVLVLCSWRQRERRTGFMFIQTHRETYWFYVHTNTQRDVQVLCSYSHTERRTGFVLIKTERDVQVLCSYSHTERRTGFVLIKTERETYGFRVGLFHWCWRFSVFIRTVTIIKIILVVLQTQVTPNVSHHNDDNI